MRVEGWHAKEIFGQIMEAAIEHGNRIMDEHVVASRAACPIGTLSREGKWITATVAFTAKAGTKKAKAVSFQAAQYTGREPGMLRDTIRRVNSDKRPGNIRVYAGSKKVNYAFFVEYGTAKMHAHPFMRPGFQQVKNNVISRLEAGIAKDVPEVKK